MQHATPVMHGLIVLAMGLAPVAAAQPVAQPTIHRVTLQSDTGVLTVTGTGLGPDLQVTVDGQPVPQLPGATGTELQVLAPVTVVTVPGTYRLTVADPMRRVGDGFVVASLSGGALAAGGGAGVAAAGGAASPTGAGGTAHADLAAPARGVSVSPNLVEDGVLQNTAVGATALASNTTGNSNVAVGYGALNANTTGQSNTAVGLNALVSNTTGQSNVASGRGAMSRNTTGDENTASGYEALRFNTIGFWNTASGFKALFLNTTGTRNTANGVKALYSNTTGQYNTAAGGFALQANTTGNYNTGNGYLALFASTGNNNTANGAQALTATTTGGNNTAAGVNALLANTTGSNNVASGVTAMAANTTGDWNVAAGSGAGAAATAGSYNVFVGGNVTGAAADTNTIRIGLPYDGASGVGQNQTFVAGIYGTQLTTNAYQVFVDANGQLGTLTPGVLEGTGTIVPFSAAPQITAQQAINAAHDATIGELQALIGDLRTRLARLEAATRGGKRQ